MYNALGVSNADDQYGVNPNAGVNAANNDIFSGMYNYKVSDLSLTQDKVMTFDIDYILMRFAEVMFIYAEAARPEGQIWQLQRLYKFWRISARNQQD